MKKLVFATNNPHKLEEIRAILGNRYEILSLAEIGCHDDIPETSDSLTGNALIKARWVRDRYGFDAFADDTGLMVDALNGRPGVYSARYAGPQCSPEDNMQLLLSELDGVPNRDAHFETVIALCLDGKDFTFKGEVLGTIATQKQGEAGFGYDPIFVPTQIPNDEGAITANDKKLSFAQIKPEHKNLISHRGRATAHLIEFLQAAQF